MVEVTLEADVPESRLVTVPLPPEVPTGRVRLTVSVESPSTVRRLQALLPDTDAGVVHSGQVRGVGPERPA